MKPIAHHIRLRLRADRVIAPSTREQRLLATAALKLGRLFVLLAFRAADTHIHLQAACDGAAACEYGRRLAISLQRRLSIGVGFEPTYVQPILDQRHLVRTFFYILRQHTRHGLSNDPLHEASNIPDLLGLRINGRYTAGNVRAKLPRVTRPMLLEQLGCAELATSDDRPEDVCFDHLADAAAAAIGEPELRGRSSRIVAARRAAAHVAAPDLPSERIAQHLGIARRTVDRLLTEPAPAELVRAVTLQLAARAQRDLDDDVEVVAAQHPGQPHRLR